MRHDQKWFPSEFKKICQEGSTRAGTTCRCTVWKPCYNSMARHPSHFFVHLQMHNQETDWYCMDCQLFLRHNSREDDCFQFYHTIHGPAKISRVKGYSVQ